VLAEAAQGHRQPGTAQYGHHRRQYLPETALHLLPQRVQQLPLPAQEPPGAVLRPAGVNRYHSIFGATNGCVAVCPSDTAPALVALKAKIVTNKKTWEAADFFVIKGEQINSLDADEIVTEIQVPPRRPAPRAPTASSPSANPSTSRW
jgi:hypothetical protein